MSKYIQVSGSEDQSSNSGKGAQIAAYAGGGCCCCCCCILFLILPWYAGGQFIAKHHRWSADMFVNCTGYPDTFCTDGKFWTPANGTRYLSWGGCRQGWKSDAELDKCGGDCFDGSLPIEADKFNAVHGWKLVNFSSRKAPDGQETVQIKAWWLPSGRANAPRVVIQHGNNANFNSRMVQTGAYLMRSMGIDVLLPSLRSHGMSEKVDDVTTWGWAYPFDTLGAWDYAVNDPAGLLGGAVNSSRVGLMGFSMGGYIVNTAFGMDGQVPGVWTDGAVFSASSMVHNGISFLGPLAGLVTPMAMRFARMRAGVEIEKYTPSTELPKGPSTKRHIMLASSSRDTFVPASETDSYKRLMGTMPDKYNVQEWLPPASCNGNAHCSVEFDMAAQDREKLCEFWGSVFGFAKAYCGLDTLPSLAEKAEKAEKGEKGATTSSTEKAEKGATTEKAEKGATTASTTAAASRRLQESVTV